MSDNNKIEKENYFHRAFAEYLVKLSGQNQPWLTNILVKLSLSVREGHSCVPLLELLSVIEDSLSSPNNQDELSTALLATSLTGKPGSSKPLILNNDRLYLRRYYEYERIVALELIRRASNKINPSEVGQIEIKNELDKLFPDNIFKEPHWQRIAVAIALQSRLAVICGGPGTGKTWVILHLLVLLARQSISPLKIALVAPTGKAAMRLTESMTQNLPTLQLSNSVLQQIPQNATTIHRLLGLSPNSTKLGYTYSQDLDLDAIVIDEASMVDLPTLARLLTAIPHNCRVIMLGDPDQLSAVETGNVLAELHTCSPPNHYSKEQATNLLKLGCADVKKNDSRISAVISDHIVTLTKTHRFASLSAIGELLKAIKAGTDDDVLHLLATGQGLRLHDSGPKKDDDDLADNLFAVASPYYVSLMNASDPAEALKIFSSFRILCAMREGRFGIRYLNQLFVRNLFKLNLRENSPSAWFCGAPLLVTENDYAVDLYNGDIGIVWHEANNRPLRVWFSGEKNSLRHFAQTQLPTHELCYAMTAHKAQGSEFDEIAIVLPDTHHPILSRQWLYTAFSRARNKVTLFGSEHVLRAALATTSIRWSGLKAMLQNNIASS